MIYQSWYLVDVAWLSLNPCVNNTTSDCGIRRVVVVVVVLTAAFSMMASIGLSSGLSLWWIEKKGLLG